MTIPQPNPFNNTSGSLKGVIDAAASIIQGDPVLPDSYNDHVDSAANDIAKLGDSPHLADDATKIMQKHFNAASNGDPQSTKLQQSFQREINKKVASLQAANRWKNA